MQHNVNGELCQVDGAVFFVLAMAGLRLSVFVWTIRN